MKIEIKSLYIAGLLLFILAIFLVFWLAIRPGMIVARCEDESLTLALSEIVSLYEEKQNEIDVFIENFAPLEGWETETYLEISSEIASLKNAVDNRGYIEETKIDAYYSCLRSHGIK